MDKITNYLRAFDWLSQAVEIAGQVCADFHPVFQALADFYRGLT